MHGSPWADIVDREDPTFDAVAGQEQEDTEIDLSGLTEKQRFVIECSFGIGRPELSERDIATLMGISGPAVHKLKEKALTKLRGLAK
jgi:DNA-directed RNA polymerase sigma subunit (sigma70/sigma32)